MVVLMVAAVVVASQLAWDDDVVWGKWIMRHVHYGRLEVRAIRFES